MKFITIENDRWSVPSMGQGEVCVGTALMATYVGSCVAVIFYAQEKRIGGLTHITGFGPRGKAHHPDEAICKALRAMQKLGVNRNEIRCYLIGGSDSTEDILNQTQVELGRQGLRGVLIDTQGRYHRKLFFFPEKGEVYLRRKDSVSSPVKRTQQERPVVSLRASNPIRGDENPHTVFCDVTQAKATTATRLFRNEEMFQALREIVLPPLFDDPRGLIPCIWSAGCSSGEETYSLAMVAANEFERRKRPMKLRLFGTDINPDRLALARAAEYLCLPDTLEPKYRTLLSKYSHRQSASIAIDRRIRSCVHFGRFDIRARPKKHTFDFIVCNHVLQYYDMPGQLHILGNLTSVLRKNGHLYAEGITAPAIDGACLDRVEGFRNLFIPYAITRSPT